MGFRLDPDANRRHAPRLSAHDSKPVLRIPADEEGMIRDLVMDRLNGAPEN